MIFCARNRDRTLTQPSYNYKSCTKSKQVKKEERNFKGYKAQKTKGMLYS
jgi:hypothetical protein